jgi:hypothetical protein
VLVAIGLVYMIMVILFRLLLVRFVILCALPLASVMIGLSHYNEPGTASARRGGTSGGCRPSGWRDPWQTPP